MTDHDHELIQKLAKEVESEGYSTKIFICVKCREIRGTEENIRDHISEDHEVEPVSPMESAESIDTGETFSHEEYKESNYTSGFTYGLTVISSLIRIYLREKEIITKSNVKDEIERGLMRSRDGGVDKGREENAINRLEKLADRLEIDLEDSDSE